MSLILGIAGQMLSGKSTAAKFYVDQCNAVSLRYSAMINEILDVLDLEQTRANQQELGRILKEQYAPTVLAKALIERIKESGDGFYLIDGFRTKDEVDEFRKLKNFKLLYIESSAELRYSRLQGREEKVGESKQTLEQFNKSQEHAVDRNIADLKQYADIIVENKGSVEDLEKQLRAVEGAC